MVNVIPTNVITNGGVVTENGAEVEVKIKLPEAIKDSLSSSIVHSGFNFKFTIPKEIYEKGLNIPLADNNGLNLMEKQPNKSL